MALRTKAHARLTSAEAGFTLVELLVASAVGMILLLVIHGFASIAERSRSETGARAEALGEQRAGLERMTRELRQATELNAATPGLITFRVLGADGAPLREIRFDCRSEARCRRFAGPAGGTLVQTHDAIVSGVESATFTAQTVDASQDYVAIELRVTLPGRPQPIVLGDGVTVRNAGGLP